jgi:hypothetical protein
MRVRVASCSSSNALRKETNTPVHGSDRLTEALKHKHFTCMQQQMLMRKKEKAFSFSIKSALQQPLVKFKAPCSLLVLGVVGTIQKRGAFYLCAHALVQVVLHGNNGAMARRGVLLLKPVKALGLVGAVVTLSV